MLKHVLVTGAAGFIGSNLVEALLARDDSVVGIDNFDPYYPLAHKRRNLSELQQCSRSENFKLVEGDIRDAELLERLFAEQRFDAVVHLAALPGVRTSIGQAASYFDVNVTGSIRLLDAARAYDVGNFVFASTGSVYGESESPPFVETAPCDRPLAPYPASKRAVELLGYSYHNLHRLNFTALRFFNVYGPRNRPDMMAFKLLESVRHGTAVPFFGGGDMRRDWTYVDDIVSGVVAAIDRPLGYEIINLGRGQPVLLREFVRLLEDVAGRKAKLNPEAKPAADVAYTCADIDKAQRLLAYEPRIPVGEGVKALWAWYCNSAPIP
jgi:UDP-glucuronate 4-epimerase